MSNASEDTTPLGETELHAFAAALDAREAALEGEVRDVNAVDQADREGFAGVAPDLVDVAEHRRGEDMRHAERERDELELAEIGAARLRMAEGVYGQCTDCGEPIARARLQALLTGQPLGVYGLGTVRTMAEYALWSGIDYAARRLAPSAFEPRRPL